MGRPAKDLVGKKFGFLTVLKKTKSDHYGLHYLCGCWCGNYTEVRGTHLRTKTTTCAMCNFIDMYPNEYYTWRAMWSRCTDTNSDGYKYYGGRGITVCARWSKFQYFLEDMGLKEYSNHSIERNLVDGNYEPGNCRWANDHVQANNKRITILRG